METTNAAGTDAPILKPGSAGNVNDSYVAAALAVMRGVEFSPIKVEFSLIPNPCLNTKPYFNPRGAIVYPVITQRPRAPRRTRPTHSKPHGLARPFHL